MVHAGPRVIGQDYEHRYKGVEKIVEVVNRLHPIGHIQLVVIDHLGFIGEKLEPQERENEGKEEQEDCEDPDILQRLVDGFQEQVEPPPAFS